jgi:hypothetical protein
MAGALKAGVRRAAEAARGKNYDEVRESYWNKLKRAITYSP